MPKLKNSRGQKRKKHLMVMVATKKKSPSEDPAEADTEDNSPKSKAKGKKKAAPVATPAPVERSRRTIKKKSAIIKDEPKAKQSKAKPKKAKKKTATTKTTTPKGKRKSATVSTPKSAPAAKKKKPPPVMNSPSEIESSDSDDVPLAEISKISPLSRGTKITQRDIPQAMKEVYELPSDDEEEEIVEDEDDEDDDDDDEEDDGEDDDDLEEEIPDSMFYGPAVVEQEDSMTCSHCKGKFPTAELHDHMNNCPERYVQCRECGKVLSNLQTLERHHKRFHLKLREVPCTLCDKMFIDEAAARKHLKTVHFKVKNFHCPNCDKSFSQRNKLAYHIRTHSGEKPFSCTECGRAFSLLWNLKTHLRTHTGEKPYGCDVCGRRFTQKQNMTSHMTTHRKKPDRRSFPTFVGGSSNLDILESNANDTATTSSLQRNYSFDRSSTGLGSSRQSLNNPGIGGQYFMDELGNLASITRMTTPSIGSRTVISSSTDQPQSTVEVNLENGLGLLSSVARKGDGTVETSGESVQVDGIVTFSDHVNGANSQGGGVTSSLDPIVEVFVQSSESDAVTHSLTTTSSQMVVNPMDVQETVVNSVEEEIVPSVDSIVVSSATGEQQDNPPGEQGNLAGLANILQNPQVLAAINAAASTNKFIVIGPVGMFGQDGTPTSTKAESTTGEAISTVAQSQQFSVSGDSLVATSVSGNIVSDATSSVDLAAMENQLINAEAIVSQADSLGRVDGVSMVNDEVTSQDISTSSSTAQSQAVTSNEALVAPADNGSSEQLAPDTSFHLLADQLSACSEKLPDSSALEYRDTDVTVGQSELVSSEVTSSFSTQDGTEAVEVQSSMAEVVQNDISKEASGSIDINPEQLPVDSSNPVVQNYLNVQELMSTYQGNAEVRSADCSEQSIEECNSTTTTLSDVQPESNTGTIELIPTCDSSSSQLSVNEADGNVV